MATFSLLAENLIGSEIVKLGNEINERKKRGEHIYNFTIGDFDPQIFPIPAELEVLIKEAYTKHHTNYPPADGIMELRQAVAEFILENEGISYTPSEILIASGGRPLIYTLFKSVVNKGEKVIYAVPSWNNNHYTEMNEAIHCCITTTPENNFMPLAEDIEPHIKDAALLCLCTPQNPTGTTLPKEELERICTLILEENNRRPAGSKKLYLMYDQMYWTLTYGNTKHINPLEIQPAMKEYTIFIDGISKAFAATGVRVGWALGPAELIGKMKSLLSHVGAWAPLAEQKATAAYLRNRSAVNEWFFKFRDALSLRLGRIFDEMIRLKNKGYAVDAIPPQAAIYLTVKFDLVGLRSGDNVLKTQQEVTAYLLDRAKLAIVPFSSFGAEKDSPWYRLSVGNCHVNDIPVFIQKLEEALETLQ
jgi:aspartate aminotransferase